MHRRRQTTLGIARSGRELFCSVSSTPRSPSPSKQDLYELLQQRHRMHSFTKRLKNCISEKDSGPEVEVPSYMRQTCSSLIKRSNSKSKSKDFSSSGGKRGNWDDQNVFAGRRRKSVRKALTAGGRGGGSLSFALNLDEHPQSTASKLEDSLANLSAEFASTSSNYDEVSEFEDNKLRNEHTMLEKDTTDEALFMTPAMVHELFDSQVPKTGTMTRDSSALFSEGSLCSVNVELGTSSNTIRFHEASRGSFEDVVLTNSHVEELDFQSNECTRSNSVKSPNHRQPSAQITVREDIHTEVLLSSGPDEQDFLCGNRSQELQEITRPVDIDPSLKSTSSSLYEHNMFCNTDESHEPFLRSSFSQDFQNSNSLLQLSTSDLQLAALNQFYDDRSESGLLYSSTKQGSFRRQSLSEGSSQDEDLEAMAEPQAALSDPTDVWGPVPNREDTKPAEEGCLEHSKSLTKENSEFYVSSGRLLGSLSSLVSSNEYPAPNGQFSSQLKEFEELRSEQRKTKDTSSPKATSSSLQNQSSLPNTIQKTQIIGSEDPGKMETVGEGVRVNPLGPMKTPVYTNNTFENSSIVYDKPRGTTTSSLSHSEEDISETESLFLVQCTKPRSLSEPFTTMQQRCPSADDIALFAKSPRSEVQFRDDHSSTLLSSFPADLYPGQELSILPDPILDQSSSRFSEVKERSDGQLDQLFVVPCDQLKDLAKFERGSKRGEVISNSADGSGSMRRRGVFQDQSTNQQSIGEIDSAEHCRSDSGSAKAVSEDQTIEQNLGFSGRSSHTFGSLQMHSSVSMRSEKGLKNRFQKFVETVKETYKEKKQQQEAKKKFPHCFQSKMKACFGCSKASAVLHEPDSMARKREPQRRASRK